ncbi:RFX DNA-binding domain-containing protein [Lipomyces oligophaga]|uniref:RFX DNA-binding domain-containing protein n=1 Tax=Lipomyces oligophaga TaxID=45792 RepID=UPI0034CD851D
MPATDSSTTPAPIGLHRKTLDFIEEADQELRRLADSSSGQSLEDLAQKVRIDDSKPGSATSERSRQVFGTVWLIKTCVVSPHNAIPRNRIYARYAEICAHHKIKPLNPAAFGKLVKLLFPGIKTRRLGVRGKSKYHYCGVTIVGDSPFSIANLKEDLLQGPDDSGHEFEVPLDNDDSFDGLTNGELDSAAPESGIDAELPQEEQEELGSIPKVESIAIEDLNDRLPPDWQDGPSDSFQIPLLFSKSVLTPPSVSFDAVPLPSIEPFIPEGSDRDSVDTLAALNHSHISSVLESIRFMHLKQFINTISSFHGTLTSPVRKLLGEPLILEWIQRCDWIMYKEMIHMLAPIALQVVPPNVVAALRSLAVTLPQTFRTSFKSLPATFIDLKLRLAQTFSKLVARLLRVNDIANTAAKVLANPFERQLMLDDWVSFVDAKSLVQREVPCGGKTVLKIVTEDLASLLPLSNDGRNVSATNNTRLGQDMGTSPLPGSIDVFGSERGDEQDEEEGSNAQEAIIEQWAEYLMNLPFRFPHVSARTFLLYLSSVVTAALREMSLHGGRAFGAWWLVRCWMDEWMAWMAEQGGFLAIEYIPDQGTTDSRNSSTGSGIPLASNTAKPSTGLENTEITIGLDGQQHA